MSKELTQTQIAHIIDNKDEFTVAYIKQVLKDLEIYGRSRVTRKEDMIELLKLYYNNSFHGGKYLLAGETKKVQYFDEWDEEYYNRDGSYDYYTDTDEE